MFDDRQIVDHSARGTEHRFAGAIGDGHGVVGTLEGDVVIGERPRQDSNLRTRLRRPMLYPLSYEGMPLGRDEASPYPRSSL